MTAINRPPEMRAIMIQEQSLSRFPSSSWETDEQGSLRPHFVVNDRRFEYVRTKESVLQCLVEALS